MGGAQSMEDSGGLDSNATHDESSASQSLRQRRQREQRLASSRHVVTGDDPWWWEVEHENLLLDVVPTSHVRDLAPQMIDVGAKFSDESIDRSNACETKEVCDAVVEAVGEPVTQTATETQSLEEFKEELRIKRLARQTAVQDLRDEVQSLRSQLAAEQQINRHLRERHGVVLEEGTTETAIALSTSYGSSEDDANPVSRSRHANIELANAQLALQLATSENISLRTELGVVQRQAGTLKEVVSCCKQMLAMKEDQCTQLKAKLREIEESFGEREMKIMSDNLRQEYERQLSNIRQLRQLYEERQRIAAAEYENLQRLISIKKDELLAAQEKTKNCEERNQTLLQEVESVNNELAALREECNEHKFENRALKEEMGAINTLFSQMIMGFNGKNNLDIDRLAAMLEENRTLLNDMATREANCTDGATLPKLLFELVEQATVAGQQQESCELAELLGMQCPPNDLHDAEAASASLTNATQQQTTNTQDAKNAGNTSEAAAGDDAKRTVVSDAGNAKNCGIQEQQVNRHEEQQQQYATTTVKTVMDSSVRTGETTSQLKMDTLKFPESEVMSKVASTQEIIGNLPKVWRVLMELLSHHSVEQVQFEEHGDGADCYKSVETPNGPKVELSVSKTYLKLKDLILEKKSLVKETNRLKSLNSHLDYRLNEQQKRLSAVSLELTKTWHLVGKMQRQHRQLHTQEQILRYQLQQKRRLLSELKEELEYCRRKWAAARAKNDESQEQCNDLRREFARRKLEDANNSAESGYSDSGQPSDEDERVGVANSTACGFSKRNLRTMFEHSRKIKRMQSTSPGRAAAAAAGGAEILLRWNSAPPTCGWGAKDSDEDMEETARPMLEVDDIPPPLMESELDSSRQNMRRSRSAQRERANLLQTSTDSDIGASALPVDRAVRIQRLEQQCKSLIQQVLETSDNRERLEIQLCEFQEQIAPVQHAVPLPELHGAGTRRDRMTRASSVPTTGALTEREEEYTRKRSERLERLEEESRQLISRIKRTSDRGHYLRCSLDRLHKTRTMSREGSFESNTEEVSITETDAEQQPETTAQSTKREQTCHENTLTAAEVAYTSQRAERLKRLEAEGKSLLTQLSQNVARGDALGAKLETLHEKYGSETATPTLEERIESIERISNNRDERLSLLEAEGKQLIEKLSSTSERGTNMINRIAEREQNRLARTRVQAEGETIVGKSETAQNNATETETNESKCFEMQDAISAKASEEFTKRDCIADMPTTTNQELRPQTSQGAIPKTKPTAVLSAAKVKPVPAAVEKQSATLEEMVKQLQNLPFPKDLSKKDENNDDEEKTAAEK